jgi:hypothetical protein
MKRGGTPGNQGAMNRAPTEDELQPSEPNDILIYQASDGKTRIEVQLDHETVWLTQVQLATLFDVKVPAISKHVSNIIKAGELDESATVSKMEIVQLEGRRRVRRKQSSYNLDMVISVGYRVNSEKATRFRQWATRVLREHLVKGYTIHEQRLREEAAKFKELRQTVDLLASTLTAPNAWPTMPWWH